MCAAFLASFRFFWFGSLQIEYRIHVSSGSMVHYYVSTRSRMTSPARIEEIKQHKMKSHVFLLWTSLKKKKTHSEKQCEFKCSSQNLTPNEWDSIKSPHCEFEIQRWHCNLIPTKQRTKTRKPKWFSKKSNRKRNKKWGNCVKCETEQKKSSRIEIDVTDVPPPRPSVFTFIKEMLWLSSLSVSRTRSTIRTIDFLYGWHDSHSKVEPNIISKDVDLIYIQSMEIHLLSVSEN